MGIADHIKNGISRRGFVLGGAAAGAATVLAGCSKKTGTSDDAAGEPQVIKDDSKIVSITDEYEAVDIDLEPAASWTLPLGTLLYYCDGDYAAAMMAPASALHANTLGVLNLGDGSLTTLIEDPIEGTGYAFYDVRAGDGVFAWVEMNFANSSWKLYAQNLSGASLSGDVAELDRGGKDYDPPLFTAFGSSVIWYKMPSAGGNKTSSDSFCYRRSLDESKAEVIWKSMGRFASAPARERRHFDHLAACPQRRRRLLWHNGNRSDRWQQHQTCPASPSLVSLAFRGRIYGRYLRVFYRGDL